MDCRVRCVFTLIVCMLSPSPRGTVLVNVIGCGECDCFIDSFAAVIYAVMIPVSKDRGHVSVMNRKRCHRHDPFVPPKYHSLVQHWSTHWRLASGSNGYLTVYSA